MLRYRLSKPSSRPFATSSPSRGKHGKLATQIGKYSPSCKVSLETDGNSCDLRWRPLEAGLAVIGSQAEPVQDCIDDEEASERPKPLDLEYLLAEVIPSLLTLSGESFGKPQSGPSTQCRSLGVHRMSIPPREMLGLRQSFCKTTASPHRRSVSRRGCPSRGICRHRYSVQNLRHQGHPQVRS